MVQHHRQSHKLQHVQHRRLVVFALPRRTDVFVILLLLLLLLLLVKVVI